MSIQTEQFIRYMPFVARCELELRELGLWWQRVTLVGKINSLDVAATLLDEMASTKRRFEELQQQLVVNLAQEKLNKLDLELGARAQVAIDILIRNLFERTADVGFLATDDDIRAFLRQPEPASDALAEIVERLREYTAKYSVYDEVIILDPDGRVCAHLDQNNPLPPRSRDRLIGETLATAEPYVETFRPSDLQPGRRAAHIFSARITESDDPRSRVLGILCLCFRFDHEMQSIFAQLVQQDELLAILDEKGRVIASSNEGALPFGCHLSVGAAGALYPVSHEGVRYLARTAPTNGYQGYFGLPWRGHVMQSTASAFDEEGASQSAPAVSVSGQLNAGELYQISRTAARVTDDLTLAVLNGQIIAAKRDAKEFMPVLNEIRGIGQQTREVFDRSIASLHRTVRDSLLSDAQFQAFLAVDIMDRNLYERANDVRWWALTSRFRELMSEPGAVTGARRTTLEAILAYINGLYTVYTNLFLFDRSGQIVAVSNPEEAGLVGTALPEAMPLHAALEVDHSQRYVVSAFEPSPLYGGRHTYVYMTSIRAPDSDRVVGGIGIVFDSEPQFRSMLEDALPRDAAGAIAAGAFGLFVERDGRIVSSTRDDLLPGERLEVEPALLRLANGERTARMTTWQDDDYVVGAAMSHGYREYKTTGDYDNDIVALIFIPV